jgi:hypothetical protein
MSDETKPHERAPCLPDPVIDAATVAKRFVLDHWVIVIVFIIVCLSQAAWLNSVAMRVQQIEAEKRAAHESMERRLDILETFRDTGVTPGEAKARIDAMQREIDSLKGEILRAEIRRNNNSKQDNDE